MLCSLGLVSRPMSVSALSLIAWEKSISGALIRFRGSTRCWNEDSFALFCLGKVSGHDKFGDYGSTFVVDMVMCGVL